MVLRKVGEALEGGLAQAALGPLLDVVGERPQEQVAARPLGWVLRAAIDQQMTATHQLETSTAFGFSQIDQTLARNFHQNLVCISQCIR